MCESLQQNDQSTRIVPTSLAGAIQSRQSDILQRSQNTTHIGYRQVAQRCWERHVYGVQGAASMTLSRTHFPQWQCNDDSFSENPVAYLKSRVIGLWVLLLPWTLEAY